MTSPLPRLPTGWKASLDALGQCPFLEEILGLEGSAARAYFQAVRGLIDPVWGFEGRQRRPPPDPVNAMLSYGNTLLVHEAVAALETAGFDPMLGYLHRHRRAGLRSPRTASPHHSRKRLGPRGVRYRRSTPVPCTRRTRQDDHGKPAASRCSQTPPSPLVRPPELPLLSLRIARHRGHRSHMDCEQRGRMSPGRYA